MARGKARIVTTRMPDEVGKRDGLAYTLWLPHGTSEVSFPPAPPRGVVILHGANSCKENHHDFARAVLPIGCAAIAYDMRGHGDSHGPLDGRALEDVATIAEVLREALGYDEAPIGLRGTSMGGLLSILATPLIGARASVAICPAGVDLIRRGIRSGRLDFPADAEAISELLDRIDLAEAVRMLDVPLLIMHAEGDEQVPVEDSRALANEMQVEGSRLLTVPGGHHRSVQHDEELQAVSLRFLDRYLR